jgi:putative CocE/NonD family hydrolase
MAEAIQVEFNVPARMRDGITLMANVYRPAAEGSWPVLLTRLPYGKDLTLGSSVIDPVQAARRGYMVVVQDTRGRFSSEGEWKPQRNEALDGVDTIAWAAELPGSDGQVGMYGASYFGFTQWAAAVEQPPALKAMVPFITWCDPFNGVLFRGGAMELGIAANWHLQMGFDVLVRRHRGDPVSLGRGFVGLAGEVDRLGSEGYWSLPIADFAPLRRVDVAPGFFEVVENGVQRDAADFLTIAGKHDRVQVPTFNIGGWYDIFAQDTIENFLAMRAAGRPAKLLIGPWSHSAQRNPIGELNFGFASQAAFIDLRIDFGSLQLRWFDHWLKGAGNGILEEPPVKIFVMGANAWRDLATWPPPESVDTSYHLRAEGALSQQPPEAGEAPDAYDYDPANPAPTLGGSLLMSPEFQAGPVDQRPIEGRPDVLTYSTQPLEKDTEVTGRVRARLWAASTAPDTDFVARLVDVHPDGRAINLTDGIIRARHRNGLEQPSPIEPGRPYEYEIDLWSTSNLFKAGHRIRLQVTSSSFPRWDRNPNTGQEFGAGTELRTARQTILHDRDHPSRVILPIVGR